MLYIISTPIGNIGDISFRAIDILKKVSLIIAEDTRRTRNLMSKYGIRNDITSYNEHTKENKTQKILSILKEGKEIALVSDSGTPLISDPGYRLVKICREEGIDVTAVPGACAFIAALTVSGCTTDRFCFLGFVPKKKNERIRFLESIRDMDMTAIIYESPHRIKKTLEAIKEVMPQRPLSLSRELTKRFEETITGDAEKIINIIGKRNIKGEIALIVDKKKKEKKEKKIT